MDIFFVPLLLLFRSVISFAMTVVVANVIVGWLMIANILNFQNRFVYALVDSLSRTSDLMLSPIRRRIPVNIGSMDISPVILILFLSFLKLVIDRILIRFV
ncbi:MAG: YggT family protein [Holosporaceae bacterium]|nr:YggT family protein [Holosporaceae bacterium]